MQPGRAADLRAIAGVTPPLLHPRVFADPYKDAKWELKIWREHRRFHAWRGQLTLRPTHGFGIPITYGNEHTGLIYGWKRASILRSARRATRDWNRDTPPDHERPSVDFEVLDL